MAIRLIALDLDGTLLRPDFSIAPADVRAVAEAAAAGVSVVLASGRMVTSMLPYYGQLGLDTPMIAFNGAAVLDSGGHITQTFLVPRDSACDVVEWARTQPIHIQAFTMEGFYYEAESPWVHRYEGANALKGRLVKDLAAVDDDLISLLMIDRPDRVAALKGDLTQRMEGRLSVFTSAPRFLEATSPRATKGQALKTLCAQLGIGASEVLAVGDALNDLEMIRFAGIGVAMGNADPLLIAEADDVTLSVEESGVAHALRRWL